MTQTFKGWKAATKEHIVPCQHQAKVYAIGMKIEGFSRDELLQNVKLSLLIVPLLTLLEVLCP